MLGHSRPSVIPITVPTPGFAIFCREADLDRAEELVHRNYTSSATIRVASGEGDMTRHQQAKDEMIAACALCPNEGCGALVISYRSAETPARDLWEFVCSRCGAEFSVPEDELLVQPAAA